MSLERVWIWKTPATEASWFHVAGADTAKDCRPNARSSQGLWNFRRQSFAVSAPAAWNQLPSVAGVFQIETQDSLLAVRRRIHLLCLFVCLRCRATCAASWTMKRLRQTFQETILAVCSATLKTFTTSTGLTLHFCFSYVSYFLCTIWISSLTIVVGVLCEPCCPSRRLTTTGP